MVTRTVFIERPPRLTKNPFARAAFRSACALLCARYEATPILSGRREAPPAPDDSSGNRSMPNLRRCVPRLARQRRHHARLGASSPIPLLVEFDPLNRREHPGLECLRRAGELVPP